MSVTNRLFRTKSENAGASEPVELRRCLTAFDLTLLGVGAIIGAGIFVLTGIAAATQAGPGIILSYLLAGLACGFAALCYAELASSVGGCGGAYSYALATLGELFAWIIGWDLLLEYGMDAATISIGWAGYVQNALHAVGIDLPKSITTDPFHGGLINLPAAAIILFMAYVLSLGVKESAKFNNIVVYIKCSVIALFIGIGLFHFNAQNWHPFLPFGAQGIVNGAGLIFFAYIGFDAVATAGEEAVNPKRDLPIGIIASLVICTVIYIVVAGLLTGIAYYPTLNVSSPVAAVLIKLGHNFAAEIVAIGAIAGLTTAIMAMYYGFTRVFLAMARDGLLPKAATRLNKKTQTPQLLIWSAGILMAFIAGIFPISQIASLVNIGTLAAFVAVCASVIILHYKQPNRVRSFKTPFMPLVPIVGILLCLFLMSSLPKITWISFSIWSVLGIMIYLVFSRKNSVLSDDEDLVTGEIGS